MSFQPYYRNILDIASNRKSSRLSIYEHLINPKFMEKATDTSFADLLYGSDSDICEYFDHYCAFFRNNTYDTVSFEHCICEVLIDSGALIGEKPGPIQSRSDFDKYPWDKVDENFRALADKRFGVIAEKLPAGMKLIGGVGNGPFEVSEDLVGFEKLCYMQIDDPELFADLYIRIGDMEIEFWKYILDRWADLFAVCRYGDDLGYKSGTLLGPQTIVDNILPEYKRIIEVIHSYDKKFLLHSCGCIFDIMDNIIDTGVDAKHSNEDVIAPYDKWIDTYNDRIGLFGGIDLDWLCQNGPDEVYDYVLEMGTKYREKAKGYALGSGNSIPDYVPVDSYHAMIRAANKIRENELKG
jgi:uroporphyrinogen decarboxylase